MKAKIQRSMLLVLFVTILIFYGLLTLVMYQKNLTLLKEEVNQEARYIRIWKQQPGLSGLPQRMVQISSNLAYRSLILPQKVPSFRGQI